MAKPLPHLFFDIDGVLAFQPEGLILALNGRYGTGYLAAEATSYPFYDTLPPAQQRWAGANRAMVAANLAPDTRAIRVLAKAVKAGYPVCIATERSPELESLTAAWLKYWQVPYGELAVVGPGNKGALLAPYGKGTDAGECVLIDDDPSKAQYARPGVDVWQPARPYNSPADGVWRFEDWRDVKAKLGLK
jgi:uncharacterized HAD superfamily protein